MFTRSVSRILFIFFLAGLFIASLAAVQEKSPGYMDADYYFASGQAVARGNGFSMPVLWNYLDDPVSLPHPSHTYWMPLVSLISALGILIGGHFTAARIPFLLISGLIAPLTVILGLRLHGNVRNAVFGGVFALLPVYYLAYLPTSDSFALLMVLGACLFLLANNPSRLILRSFGIGLIIGLLHLARTEGVIWLLVLPAWALWERVNANHSMKSGIGMIVVMMLTGLVGYLLPTAFWYGRNLMVWGSLFPPGGTRALWLTGYEDTFLFPASQLTIQRWLASGWEAILSARSTALLANLQTFVAVQSSVVLSPFILVGMVQLRKQAAVKVGVGMWVVLYVLMSIVFPYAGTNGAFFHSGAAFQPLFWAVIPVGIEQAVSWVAQLRKWQRGAAVRIFLETLLVIVCLMLSVMMYFQRVSFWNGGEPFYLDLESKLVNLGATPGDVVMINAPPGYYLITGRPAIPLPYGDESAVLAAGAQFHARYLILESANAWYLGRLYNQPGDYPGLHFVTNDGDARIYAFTTP